MNFRRRQADDELEINLIPLIDVLLVILIFLAATTSFTRYSQLQLTLPQAHADAQQNDALNMAISQQGIYALDGQLLSDATAQDLAQALRTAIQDRDDAVLVINADAQATHESVVRAMEAARLAGIARVNFAAQSSP
ncbi:biopolymer transporter ExbD [Alcaligenaceae bacterium]|nr:biopolymer transporter ExbD [Alcaligenaceae bacterium]